MSETQLRWEHRRLVQELRRLPFLPFRHPEAAKRREDRRRINRRLIEIEEAMPPAPSSTGGREDGGR